MKDNFDVQAHMTIWTQVVSVQQHFNDLGWRIRSIAITTMTFTLGAAFFGYLNATPVPFQDGTVNPAALVPILGLLIWAMFWFMDALWFHRLLKGAGNAATETEALLNAHGIAANLSGEIYKASPVKVWGRSTRRLHTFYLFGAAVLVGTTVVLYMLPTQP